MIRRAWGVLLTVLALVALTACTGAAEEPDPRPLTTDEAQWLALMRFRNFDAGTRSVDFEVSDGGLTFVVDAQVDFTGSVGYGMVTDPGGTETLLLGWGAAGIATRPWSEAGLPRPAPAIDEEWTISDLRPEQSRLHAVLAIVLELGNDRPDNALLLQQTDARWLREDVITTTEGDQVEVIVVAGPTSDAVYDPSSGMPDDGSAATVRYWLDDTGLVHRVQVRLGGGGQWTTLDLGVGSGTGLAEDLGELATVLGAR